MFAGKELKKIVWTKNTNKNAIVNEKGILVRYLLINAESFKRPYANKAPMQNESILPGINILPISFPGKTIKYLNDIPIQIPNKKDLIRKRLGIKKINAGQTK